MAQSAEKHGITRYQRVRPLPLHNASAVAPTCMQTGRADKHSLQVHVSGKMAPSAASDSAPNAIARTSSLPNPSSVDNNYSTRMEREVVLLQAPLGTCLAWSMLHCTIGDKGKEYQDTREEWEKLRVFGFKTMNTITYASSTWPAISANLKIAA